MTPNGDDDRSTGPFEVLGPGPIPDRVGAEAIVRALVAGAFPDENDTIKFTLEGWIFAALSEIGVGNALQILQTNSGGTAAEWSNTINIPSWGRSQSWMDDLVLNLPSGDATPGVENHQIWKTLGTTAITNFLNGFVGQRLIILATDSITITDNANIVLAGGANFAMTDSDTLVLQMFNAGVWHELSRSVN